MSTYCFFLFETKTLHQNEHRMPKIFGFYQGPRNFFLSLYISIVCFILYCLTYMIESQIYLACLLGLSRYRLHGEKRLSCRNCSKLSCLNLDCIGEIVVIYLIPIGEIKISIHRFHVTAFPFPFSSQISACISFQLLQ